MNARELINTLPNSNRVALLDRGEHLLVSIATAKWFKKNAADKCQRHLPQYLDLKVLRTIKDEYGNVALILNCGLTKREQAIEDEKFRKAHGGKSRERVRQENLAKFFSLLATPMTMMGDSPYYGKDF